jgi:hypothetical protein
VTCCSACPRETSNAANVAVCLLPGTELSFAEEVRKVSSIPWLKRAIGHKTAIRTGSVGKRPGYPKTHVVVADIEVGPVAIPAK